MKSYMPGVAAITVLTDVKSNASFELSNARQAKER